ncbi:MAG TPA: polysaccharide biosynthesis tyrosine autokinase [Blastocatellia bacterium]|nr:polysaccharide biosynthesis tyrosine autokinase [Blastocatellia bacterium]
MADEKIELERIPPPATPPLDVIARDSAGLRPHYPAGAGYGYGYGGGGEGKMHLRELWRTLRKRKWLILTLVFVITTLVTIEMYRTKNVYQAATLIEIGKDNSRIGQPGGSIFGDDYDPFYMVNIKTKMLMIRSHAMLESVVVENHLDQNPKFMQSDSKKSVWEALHLIGARVGLASRPEDAPSASAADAVVTANESSDPAARTPDEKKRLEGCIAKLNSGITVEPVKETRALRITFSHSDPELAALVTNSLATNFLSRNFESKTQKFTDAARWLNDSTGRLKAKVQEAEEKLAAYTREHGIFLTDKDGTLTTTKLSRLHDEALRAESERVLKESLYQEVKEGRVRNNPEAYADLLFKTSPKMIELQKQLAELQSQKAELSVKYGDENPKVREVNERVAAIEKQIGDSQLSLEEKLKTEYERALRDEEKFKAMLAAAKGEATVQNEAAIQFNLLKQEVETNKQLYQDFLNRTNQAEAQKVEQQNNLRIIEAAEVPSAPVSPRRGFTIFAALLLSMGVGVGLAFFLEYLDNTIKTVEDVSRYAQLPALSVIPAAAGSMPRKLAAKSRKAIAATPINSDRAHQLVTLDPHSSAAEAYRVLRTSVLLWAAGQPPKTVLITSGQPGEGKTTTAINTAISLAQLGASVLIIDCDLRRPTTHKVLGVEHVQGLSTYLSQAHVTLDDVIQPLPIENLSLLPCGPIPPNPAELIISDRMKEMLNELSMRYDHIIIDSPPLINVTDPVILSTMVDGVILVVHGGKSTRDIVRRARQELATVGAKIFGVVLNNVDLRREGYDNSYYNRYYSNYSENADKATP